MALLTYSDVAMGVKGEASTPTPPPEAQKKLQRTAYISDSSESRSKKKI